MTRMLLFLLTWFVPATTFAYIGPGAGISAIGSLLVLLAAVLLAVIGFIWYPLKRLLKKRKLSDNATKEKDKEKFP